MATVERARVGVVGASGYSGAVAARLLAGHPRFELAWCTSDRWTGDEVRARVGAPVPGGLRFRPNSFVSEGLASEGANGVDAVVLATSAEVSLKIAGDLLAASKIVVDLSGAFRLDRVDDYPKWYRFTHDEPELLSIAHYGLPEIFGRPRGALVANPGCYPTAAILALAPLVREGLVEIDGAIVDAKSGATGAGRQAGDGWSFAEVADDFRAYRLLAHQHTPEIAQVLSKVARAEKTARVTFTAHLLPVRRGLLTTCYARATTGASADRLVGCMRDAYANSPFVEVVPPEEVSLASVVGTNVCRVGVATDGEMVIAVGAIDNLIKGAAGQAVQNLNLMFSFDETAGLDTLQRSTP